MIYSVLRLLREYEYVLRLLCVADLLMYSLIIYIYVHICKSYSKVTMSYNVI